MFRRSLVLALCHLSLVGIFLSPLTSARAETDLPTLVQAVKDLGVNWQRLSQTSELLIIGCANNTFKAVRLAGGASVSVDLLRSSSVMQPYLPIVRITGRFQQNNSPQDGACHSTAAAAMRSTRFWDNEQDYDYEVHYQIQNNELWLTSGNVVFQNNFMRQSGTPTVEPGSAWLKAFRFPLR